MPMRLLVLLELQQSMVSACLVQSTAGKLYPYSDVGFQHGHSICSFSKCSALRLCVNKCTPDVMMVSVVAELPIKCRAEHKACSHPYTLVYDLVPDVAPCQDSWRDVSKLAGCSRSACALRKRVTVLTKLAIPGAEVTSCEMIGVPWHSRLAATSDLARVTSCPASPVET